MTRETTANENLYNKNTKLAEIIQDSNFEDHQSKISMELAFPYWDFSDDSQSCDWNVESSDSSILWDNEENSIDDAFSIELDEYLNMIMHDNKRRKVRFDKRLVTAVYQFEKVSKEYHPKLYYTAKEFKDMVADFVKREGNINLLSSATK